MGPSEYVVDGITATDGTTSTAEYSFSIKISNLPPNVPLTVNQIFPVG